MAVDNVKPIERLMLPSADFAWIFKVNQDKAKMEFPARMREWVILLPLLIFRVSAASEIFRKKSNPLIRCSLFLKVHCGENWPIFL